MPTDDERYRQHLRDTGQEDDPALRRAWEEEDARNRQAQEAPGSWQDRFGRARGEWERDTRRTGEWDRWSADEREREFAQHAQRLGYGSAQDLQDYLSGRPPGQEKGTYDDLMGRIADARAAREGGLYQVKPGDTLSQIAQRFGLDVEDLLKWNPRPDRNLLRVGEVITLPAYRAAKTPPPQPTSIPQGGLLGRPPEGAPTGHWQDEAIPMPPVGSAEWLRWAAGPKTRRVWKEDEPTLARGNLDWLRRRLMPEAAPVSPQFGEGLAPIGEPGVSEDDTARQLERMFTGQIAETPQTGLLEGLTAAGEAAYLPSQALAYLGSRLTGGPEEWSPESTEWANILRRLGLPEGEGRPMTPEEREMGALYTGAVSPDVVPETAPPSLRDMLAAFLQYGPGDPLNYPLAAFTAPGRLLTRGAAGLAERAAARGGRAAVEAAEALAPGARRLAAGEAGAIRFSLGNVWDDLPAASKEFLLRRDGQDAPVIFNKLNAQARRELANDVAESVGAKPLKVVGNQILPETEAPRARLVAETGIPEAEVAKPLPGQAAMLEAGVTPAPVAAVPAKLTRAQQQLLDAEMLKRGAEKGPIGESGYVRYEGEGEQAVMRAVPQAEVDEVKRVLFAPETPPAAVLPEQVLPETEAIDLTGRTILEPPPSAITPELAEEIRQARLAEIPSPAEAIPDSYAASWNNMPLERRTAILKALGRDEGLASSSWETIAQTEREAIIEGVARRSEDAWQALDDPVSDTVAQGVKFEGVPIPTPPAALAGAGGGRGIRSGGRRGRGGAGGAPPSNANNPPAAVADIVFGYPGESNAHAALRQWDGARALGAEEAKLWWEDGQRLMSQGQAERVKVGRDEMEALFKALHGEGNPPPELRAVFEDLRAKIAQEGADMLLVDPNFESYLMANPDYFPRGWRVPKKGPPEAGRGSVGVPPGFLKERVQKTFSELLDLGYEPVSWNPYDMLLLRRLSGIEYRENLVLLQKLQSVRLALPVAEAPKRGWRVPKVGPAFQGTPEHGPIAVPSYVANTLETVFGLKPTLKAGPVDVIAVSRAFANVAKRGKLLGSLFQHVDFASRAGFVAMTPTGIMRGVPLKYPSLIARLMNVSLRKSPRQALVRRIVSDNPLYRDFPISLRMVAEEGWQIAGDPTILRRETMNALKQMLEEAPRGLPSELVQKVKERVASVPKFFEDGLFDGVYRETQSWALENFIIPVIRKAHPTWTPRQVAGSAAEEVNKMFSSLGEWQTVFNAPAMKELTRQLIFSTGESEAWIRQALGVVKGPNKRLWQEYSVGMILALVAVANAVHVVSTGEPLPADRYIPIKVGDRYSFLPGGISYNTEFLSPDLPFTGQDGRRLKLDIVGQADTFIRWILDAPSAFGSRLNLLPRAAMNQVEGQDFWGHKMKTLQDRGQQFAIDMFSPIGFTNITEALKQINPEWSELPGGEERVGVTGSLIQASGLNVRAARNVERLDEIAQHHYGRNWNELTLPERRKQEVAGEAEAFLPPKGGGVNYEDSLYGRIADYWDRADAIYEDYRQQLEAVPIGQSFDRTKLTDARQQVLNNLKKELKLSDDDLYGERPFVSGRLSLTDMLMWIIRQGENLGRAVGAIPGEAPTPPEPHYEALNRTLAQSPPMLEAWLRGLQPGTLGPLPIGQRIPAIKGENEDFSQNEKQMFRRMSDVYYAIPDNIKDRNNIINWDLSTERQEQFLRALPEPMRERFYQYLKRNQSPGDMVRGIYQEWVAGYYNVKGATPQETAALRQQWLVGHPAPNASDIAVDILHRYGYRFTEKEEDVDHPRKYHVTELSDALAGLNLPDIDEYQRRTNAQKVLRLQETGQGFYATSGILVDRNNLPEYQKAQQWLEETEAQRDAWKASEGSRKQRDGLYAYRDQLREAYNAIHDNPDISLDDKQAAYEDYKAKREGVNNQLASVRLRIPSYPVWPDYVAKYFSTSPSASDRESIANQPVPTPSRRVSNDATIAQIFETMPTTEKGATAQQVRDWWSQNEARLRELGYRPEPKQEEIGKIWGKYWELKDNGQTREASAYLNQMKPRLAELGYVFKDGGQPPSGQAPRTGEIASTANQEWWDALTTEGTPEWRREFERVHNRPPNNIDYFRDYLWSLDFQRSKGRGPSRAEWERHYWQDVRQGRPRSRTPEFAPSGNGNRTLTNAQWRSVQDLLGRTGTNELIGSRFDSDRMSADARNTLRRYYREHPYGARNFSDWLLMARNSYRREPVTA